ncbi:hypothetical protein GMRT_22504 [Giardia muris]|uniref:Uncharacterized protein n=1 Tax=Giardia muris TaxID=5742 RepID=A0A4Z1SSC1_GIAMU|nr:hypothetical protein GMRT_22504 [Giardia muris]|eukprot:TNJ28842.1 hypothetical protein GMRT_22504 [Giardia muris]
MDAQLKTVLDELSTAEAPEPFFKHAAQVMHILRQVPETRVPFRSRVMEELSDGEVLKCAGFSSLLAHVHTTLASTTEFSATALAQEALNDLGHGLELKAPSVQTGYTVAFISVMAALVAASEENADVVLETVDAALQRIPRQILVPLSSSLAITLAGCLKGKPTETLDLVRRQFRVNREDADLTSYLLFLLVALPDPLVAPEEVISLKPPFPIPLVQPSYLIDQGLPLSLIQNFATTVISNATLPIVKEKSPPRMHPIWTYLISHCAILLREHGDSARSIVLCLYEGLLKALRHAKEGYIQRFVYVLVYAFGPSSPLHNDPIVLDFLQTCDVFLNWFVPQRMAEPFSQMLDLLATWCGNDTGRCTELVLRFGCDPFIELSDITLGRSVVRWADPTKTRPIVRKLFDGLLEHATDQSRTDLTSMTALLCTAARVTADHYTAYSDSYVILVIVLLERLCTTDNTQDSDLAGVRRNLFSSIHILLTASGDTPSLFSRRLLEEILNSQKLRASLNSTLAAMMEQLLAHNITSTSDFLIQAHAASLYIALVGLYLFGLDTRFSSSSSSLITTAAELIEVFNAIVSLTSPGESEDLIRLQVQTISFVLDLSTINSKLASGVATGMVVMIGPHFQDEVFDGLLSSMNVLEEAPTTGTGSDPNQENIVVAKDEQSIVAALLRSRSTRALKEANHFASVNRILSIVLLIMEALPARPENWRFLEAAYDLCVHPRGKTYDREGHIYPVIKVTNSNRNAINLLSQKAANLISDFCARCKALSQMPLASDMFALDADKLEAIRNNTKDRVTSAEMHEVIPFMYDGLLDLVIQNIALKGVTFGKASEELFVLLLQALLAAKREDFCDLAEQVQDLFSVTDLIKDCVQRCQAFAFEACEQLISKMARSHHLDSNSHILKRCINGGITHVLDIMARQYKEKSFVSYFVADEFMSIVVDGLSDWSNACRLKSITPTAETIRLVEQLLLAVSDWIKQAALATATCGHFVRVSNTAAKVKKLLSMCTGVVNIDVGIDEIEEIRIGLLASASRKKRTKD